MTTRDMVCVFAGTFLGELMRQVAVRIKARRSPETPQATRDFKMLPPRPWPGPPGDLRNWSLTDPKHEPDAHK